MKKNILSVIALAATLTLTSCFSDDSSDPDYGYADFAVSGIESSYTKTSYVGEVLSIAPSVETAFAEGDVEYQWMLLSERTGEISEKGDTLQPTIIGTAKNLDYEVNLAPGNYQVRFIARNTRNGYEKISYTSLMVVTEFSAGFYILKETTDGQTDLDLYTRSGTVVADLLAKTHGAPMQGKPHSLWVNYNQYYINPDNDAIESSNSVTVISDQRQFLTLRTSDLGTMFDRSNLLFDEMEADEQPYAFLFHPMYGTLYLSSKGFRYANHPDSQFGNSESAGKFGMADPTFCGSPYVTIGLSSYGGINFWDEPTHSLTGANYNFMPSPILYDDFSGEEQTQNLTNYKALAAGRSIINDNETDIILLEDEATHLRYAYLMSNSFFGQTLTRRIAIPAGSHFASATHFAVSGQAARYIYAVDGNRVYAINYEGADYEEIEIPTPGIGQGETVTYVSNQFIAYSDNADFDYLLVGTQQGSTYKLYFYDTVGGAPSGSPIAVAQGTGTLKSVRNISPNARVNYMSLGYAVYPIND